jgi:hypothetical protein
MWTYEQLTGNLFDDTYNLIGTGYSGFGQGKNDPNSDDLPEIGPIPRGGYIIKAPMNTVEHGPFAIGLVPVPENDMHGRSGFLMHGDSITNPGLASKGCIIMPRAVREKVWASGDRLLHVASGETETT